jgi:hypothetical protein
MKNIPRFCRPLRHCGDWRRCEHCARTRQATIANRAELLSNQFDTLFLSILVPVEKSARAIQRIRAALMRKAFAPAGLWTVETGEKLGGLHLNIIAPAPAPELLRDCSTWSQAIDTSARAAAAYISKQSGHPEPAEYSGHLYGTWSRVADIAIDPHMPPTVQAASAEAALSNKHPDAYLRAALASREQQRAEETLTREQYHAIARRNLPNLYAVIRGREPGEDG